ncbi:MAG: NAD(P)/FAD-dependent oxidoreductase, partial [Sphingomicrobium sp.]
MTDFDVIIVGGGIAGASLGAALDGRVKAAIIEAEDHCPMHSTGRSAAFWLAPYGGAAVMPLTLASQADLEAGWPLGERSWLHGRGSITIARESVDLRDALSIQTAKAPLHEIDRREMEKHIPGLRQGWEFGVYDPSCADIDVGGLHSACTAHFRRLGGTLLCSTPLKSA